MDHEKSPARRRSSTTSRLTQMINGQGTNSSTTQIRQRRASFQGQNEAAHLLDPSASGGSLSSSTFGRLSLRKRTCKTYLLGLLIVATCYFTFTFLYDVTHTADPCEVAERLKIRALSPTKREALKSTGVPKIIHQQWKTEHIDKPAYVAWRKKWLEIFPEPEYKHMLWTDETQRQLIEEHYRIFLQYYESYEFGIQRADASRYFILFHYGGLYADLDYEPLENFWEYLPTDRVGLIESPYQYNEKVQNSMMSSPKEDPFWERAFKVLIEDHDKPVLSSTGPVFLDKVIGTNPEPFDVLPCETFHRIPLGELKQSPFLTLLHREVLGRIYPMKQCGEYDDMRCQLGRHHNTATYIDDTGLSGLLGLPYDFMDKVLMPVGFVLVVLVVVVIGFVWRRKREKGKGKGKKTGSL